MARTQTRFVRRVALNGGTTDYALASLTLQAALPVGIASAAVDLIVADLATFLVFGGIGAYMKTLDITH